jgi:CheY-like chemotaxis protein
MTRPRRILVVEDDDTLRETIGEVMADDGHEVRMARNGHEALERLDGWEAEVVILDVMMPRMDAHEFRSVQLRDGIAPDARILVLSAAPDVASAAEKLQADAWVAKPFVLSRLIEVVDELLHRPGSHSGSG